MQRPLSHRRPGLLGLLVPHSEPQATLSPCALRSSTASKQHLFPIHSEPQATLSPCALFPAGIVLHGQLPPGPHHRQRCLAPLLPRTHQPCAWRMGLRPKPTQVQTRETAQAIPARRPRGSGSARHAPREALPSLPWEEERWCGSGSGRAARGPSPGSITRRDRDAAGSVLAQRLGAASSVGLGERST
jgi:hypothetical protein